LIEFDQPLQRFIAAALTRDRLRQALRLYGVRSRISIAAINRCEASGMTVAVWGGLGRFDVLRTRSGNCYRLQHCVQRALRKSNEFDRREDDDGLNLNKP